VPLTGVRVIVIGVPTTAVANIGTVTVTGAVEPAGTVIVLGVIVPQLVGAQAAVKVLPTAAASGVNVKTALCPCLVVIAVGATVIVAAHVVEPINKASSGTANNDQLRCPCLFIKANASNKELKTKDFIKNLIKN
jgi:hypothetical protein